MANGKGEASALEPATVPASETRVVSVLVSLLGLGLVDNQILSPILPQIAGSLGASESTVGLTVSGYAIAAAIAALIAGPKSDRAGRRPLLLAAGLIFASGSFIAALAGSFALFLAARVVTGGAAGIISALVVAAIADVVPYERRGRAMGWVGVAYFAAPITGLLLAGWVAERVGWRVNYMALVALGCVLSAAIALWFVEPTRATFPKRGDYLQFFRSRSTAAGAVSAFFVTGGLTGFLTFLGAYLQHQFELSAGRVGLVLALSSAFSLVGALGAGRLSDKMGKLPIALAGSVALVALFLIVPRVSGVALYGTLALVGFAAAARVAPLQSIVTELVSQETRGAYVALRNTLSQGGSAAAAALAAFLYTRGFEYICWMTASFTVVAFVLLLMIEEPRET